MSASQVAVLAVVVGLVGCDSPARVKPWRHAPDPTAEAAGAPRSPALADMSAEADVRAARGHTLRIHLDSEPGRLNPLVAPTVWGRRITLGTVFEPLLRYVPAEGQAPARYAPRLARSWRVMPGGQEIRIELEPDVTFHDGRPLTTSDVQFTLDAVRDSRRGIDQLWPLLADIERVELITSREIRLTLKRPSGWVLRALAELPILPMHVYDGSLLAGGALIGSGPYKVASNKNGTVHLVRYEKYWGGPAPIADIELVYEPDAALVLKDAKRGEFDVVPALIPAHYPDQANAPGIAAAFDKLELRPLRMRYLAFNASRAPLDDPRLRHALALLVNRREIAERTLSRLARPALFPIWPGGFVNGPETPVPDFDPKAAGALFDAAGWTDTDKDGIRDRGGQQLRIVMIGLEHPQPKDASGPPPKTERDLFADAARKIGVVIELKTGTESWLQKKLEDGHYDVVEEVWTGMVDSDISARFKDPHRAGSPRIDRALDALAAAWDPAEREKLAPELAAALAETWPIAGIVAESPQGLVHKRVKGWRVSDGWIDLSKLELDPKR
jgi:peptide/nickel transport system substrate-binding protein